MIKRIVSLLFLLLFLSGCAGAEKDMDSAISLRQRLLKSKGCQFTCEVTADYTDVLYTFSLECICDEDGNLTFAVLQPQSISGITGRIDGNGGKLTFDDKAIGFPILSEGQLTPLSAPWLFIRTLRCGYMQSCESSNDGLTISLTDTYEQDALGVDVCTDKEHKPVYCEFFWRGRRILSISIQSFSYL